MIEDALPEELYLNQVEHISLNGEQTKQALTDLTNSAGWKWFMRYAHDKSWRTIKRWVNSDILSKEELEQRNLDMRQAKAVFLIPQLLKDVIASVDSRIEKERNPQ